MHTVDLPELEDLASASDGRLTDMLVFLEGLRRRTDALLAEGLGHIERRVAYAADGHMTPTAWARATFNWSYGEATRMAQVSRLLPELPLFRQAVHAGEVPVAHTTELARACGNPRCGKQLAHCDETFAEAATSLWFHEFRVVVRRWEALADMDGADTDHDDAHRARRASISIVGAQAVLDAQGGVMDGVAMREILERFCEAEFRTDCKQAQQTAGEPSATGSTLPRTAQQRQWDALVAIFEAAAGAAVAAKPAEPLVNIIVDAKTAEELLRQLAGERVAPPHPAEFFDRRCQTVDGIQLDRRDVAGALLVGQFRRVVYDAAGVVIDLGRRSRLFRGGARSAVFLSGSTCIWPGCCQQSGRCQTDHSQAWSADSGTTDPRNGGLLCPHHNLHKERGFSTRRDQAGLWHTYRPDGSEVGEHARVEATQRELQLAR